MNDNDFFEKDTINNILMKATIWQSQPFFHNFTCGNNSQHRNLNAIILREEVVFHCIDCNYLGEVPPLFKDKNFTVEELMTLKENMIQLQKHLKKELF